MFLSPEESEYYARGRKNYQRIEYDDYIDESWEEDGKFITQNATKPKVPGEVEKKKEEEKIKGRVILSLILAPIFLGIFETEKLEELLGLLGHFIIATILMYILVYLSEGIWYIIKEFIRK